MHNNLDGDHNDADDHDDDDCDSNGNHNVAGNVVRDAVRQHLIWNWQKMFGTLRKYLEKDQWKYLKI